MEIRKCVRCGGDLKRLHLQKIWICPYCEARYADEEQKPPKASVKYHGLNKEVFLVEKTLSKVMKDNGGGGCIRSIVHCMNTFETSDRVEKYLLNLPFSDDISVYGVREEQIKKAMPVLEPVMDPDERVIVLGNKGIFTKGKEYFVITDRRSIFVKNKNLKETLHTDIYSLKFQTCGNCNINEDYDKSLINLDGNGKFQGAIIAYICMRSFEADPERDRIQIV